MPKQAHDRGRQKQVINEKNAERRKEWEKRFGRVNNRPSKIGSNSTQTNPSQRRY